MECTSNQSKSVLPNPTNMKHPTKLIQSIQVTSGINQYNFHDGIIPKIWQLSTSSLKKKKFSQIEFHKMT